MNKQRKRSNKQKIIITIIVLVLLFTALAPGLFHLIKRIIEALSS